MHQGVLEEMYGALQDLVFMSELHGARATVTLIDDRYQRSLSGGYKDILVLIKINGYACEVQLNIDKIIEIKEDKGHKQYELTRS